MNAFRTMIDNMVKKFAVKFENSKQFREKLVESYHLEDFSGPLNKLEKYWIYCGPGEWDLAEIEFMFKKHGKEWDSIGFNCEELLRNYIKDQLRKEFPGTRFSKKEWEYIHKAAERAWDIKFRNRGINVNIEYPASQA